MGQTIDTFKTGERVRITQQIPQRDGDCWTSILEGAVVRFEQAKTGSWYAHAKHERLWLDRLTIRKDDGEISVANLDRYTHVERG
ncbi:MAG: hypothetical protein WC058_13730 [Phycisphaeraceae bacterium]